jgi:hypothetical protein
MLDDSIATPLGSLILSVHLGSRKFRHEFAVMQCSHSLLLRIDFLHSAGVVLDLKLLRWGFSGAWKEGNYPFSHVHADETTKQPSTIETP